MKLKNQMILRLFVLLLNTFIIIFNVAFKNYSQQFNIIIAFYVLALSIYITFKSRNNIAIFIMMLFITYCNYSILYGRYINPSIAQINEVIRSTYYDGVAINVMLLFMTTIYCFLKPINKVDLSAGFLMSEKRTNRIITWGAMGIIVIISLLFYTPDIGNGRAGYSPIYEYSIIFFILGLYYSGKRSTYTVKVFIILLFLYVIRDFIGGHRVPGLQVLIVYFLFFIMHKIDYKKVIILSIIGIVIMSTLSIYRSSLILGDFSIISGFGNVSKNKFAFDTAYAAYLTSLTFVATKDLYSVIERAGHFFNFLASQLIIGTVGESIIQISRKHFFHVNGGVLPIYLFYYIGWIGTLLAGILVTFYLNFVKSVDEHSSGLKKVLTVYIVATVPRWYLYSPNQLLRGVLLMTIVYWITTIINSIIPRKSISIRNNQGNYGKKERFNHGISN
ncbi:MAG: hypothetical protein ACOWWR_12040 [Eubacteriales bacterium]